jgi:hypothetical protein
LAGNDPVGRFMELGVPQAAAKGMLRIVQRKVTPRVRVLLPGIENSPAPEGLIIAQAVLMKLVPDLTAQLIGVEDAFSAPGVALSSVLPLILLDGVSHDLIRHSPKRKNRDKPGQGMVHPGLELAAAFTRQIWETYTPPPEITKPLGEALRKAVTDAVSDDWTRSFAGSWTSYALRAAMVAMAEHEDDLPVPGRGDPSSLPGKAFQVGRGLVVSAALMM